MAELSEAMKFRKMIEKDVIRALERKGWQILEVDEEIDKRKVKVFLEFKGKEEKKKGGEE